MILHYENYKRLLLYEIGETEAISFLWVLKNRGYMKEIHVFSSILRDVTIEGVVHPNEPLFEPDQRLFYHDSKGLIHEDTSVMPRAYRHSRGSYSDREDAARIDDAATMAIRYQCGLLGLAYRGAADISEDQLNELYDGVLTVSGGDIEIARPWGRIMPLDVPFSEQDQRRERIARLTDSLLERARPPYRRITTPEAGAHADDFTPW